MNSSNTVSTELRLWLVAPDQTMVPLEASFLYSGEDPYAVRLAFRAGLDQPVEWIFARDLLSTDSENRDGVGDVKVWPSAGSERSAPGSVLHIELTSPFGQAEFEAPAVEIADFVRRTCQVVPIGEESAHIDIEAELDDLLGQAS
jgi:Streptomyces sporulation and cell division protein, SsgA